MTLKTKGLFVLTVPQNRGLKSEIEINYYTKEKIEEIIKNANFKIVGYKSFLGYWKNIGNRRELVYYYGYLLSK